MTSGGSPTGPSVTKLGGFALIGLGVLAAVFGVATIVFGGTPGVAQSTPSALPPPATVTSPVPETSAAPESSTAAGSDAATSPARTSPGRPSGGNPVMPPDSGQSPPAPSHSVPGQAAPRPESSTPGTPDRNAPGKEGDRRVAVRIYNNSMIRGLAHRAAEDFRQAGYTVAEVGNYSGGRIPTTTIYYRQGTAEQDQAGTIGTHLGARTKPRFDGITDASPGIIVIVTKDYDGFEPGK